jgi:hypothetical protein
MAKQHKNGTLNKQNKNKKYTSDKEQKYKKVLGQTL